MLQGALLKRVMSSWPHWLHCAAWETALEYQWMCFFFFGVLAQNRSSAPWFFLLHLYPSIFSSRFLVALSLYRPNFWPSFIILFISQSVSFAHCLCCWGSSSATGLTCAVVFFLHRGKETSCIDSAPSTQSFSLSLFVSVSGRLFPDLCTNVVPAVFSISLFLIFPTSPLGFPKCLLYFRWQTLTLSSSVAGCNCVLSLHINVQDFTVRLSRVETCLVGCCLLYIKLMWKSINHSAGAIRMRDFNKWLPPPPLERFHNFLMSRVIISWIILLNVKDTKLLL